MTATTTMTATVADSNAATTQAVETESVFSLRNPALRQLLSRFVEASLDMSLRQASTVVSFYELAMSPQELRRQVAVETENRRQWLERTRSRSSPLPQLFTLDPSLNRSAPGGPHNRPPLSPSHLLPLVATTQEEAAEESRRQKQNGYAVQDIARWYSEFSVIPTRHGVMELLEEDERWTGSADELARAAARTVAITCQRVAEGLDDDL